MSQHHFHLEAVWNGGRLGNGNISAGNLKAEISVPSELGGPGTGTNPEEMLIGSAATCYLITLAAVLGNRKLPIAKLTLSTEGVVEEEGGLHFEQIIHRPHILLESEATDEQKETARKAAERAEQACMISKALRGNVKIHVEPIIAVNGK